MLSEDSLFTLDTFSTLLSPDGSHSNNLISELFFTGTYVHIEGKWIYWIIQEDNRKRTWFRYISLPFVCFFFFKGEDHLNVKGIEKTENRVRIVLFSFVTGLGSPYQPSISGSRRGFIGCFSSLFIEVWCLEHFIIIFICTSQPSLAYFPRTMEL